MEQPEININLSQYLEASGYLDYTHPTIQQLISEQKWDTIQGSSDLIGAIYTFVRDEILFGYSRSFSLSASKILKRGYGNSITKSILLMALLRARGIPCRFQASTIDKVIFKGLVSQFTYKLITQYLYHGSVEVLCNTRWIELEGHTIDTTYLSKLQQKFPDYMGSFYGYGIAVLNFKNPDIRWDGKNTFIQNRAIEERLGLFATPDEFFTQYPQVDSFTTSFRYRYMVKESVNKRIKSVRAIG